MLKLHHIILSIILMLGPLTTAAQSNAVSGRIVDSDSRQPLQQATLKLYSIGHSDTTFLAGVLSDAQGRFSISTQASGHLLLKVTYLGYHELTHAFDRNRRQATRLGDLPMRVYAVVLNEAVVTANIPKMVIKDDTVVYNADAFRVPEGSVIEALVEVLPGAKVDEDGKISINGKNVKKFKMDGRDFMTGNNDAVMKNLPSYVIDQVKAYDEKSDLSRLTGIDDGNDDFVLEFVTKRSARRGLQANPDVGYGSDHRYGIRLTAMKPFGAMRYTFMGNANNVNDRNFSGRGGRGRGNGQGQRETKTAALDASYENNRNLKMSGRVTWTHNDADNWNRTASESFVNTRGGAFSNGINQSYSRANNWTGNMNLQWTIDSLTTLSFRPNISLGTNDSQSTSTTASFNDDPFLLTDNPLSTEGRNLMANRQMIVNDRQNKSLRYSDSHNISSQLQLFRRFGNKGRNAAISTNINYRDGDSRNASLSAVHLYQQQNSHGSDSTYQTNRYTLSPDNSFSYSLGLTYTEPILTFLPKPAPEDTLRTPSSQQRSRGPFGGNRNQRRSFGAQGLFLQLNYRYSYNYQKSDPSTYDFPDYTELAFNDVINGYRE